MDNNDLILSHRWLCGVYAVKTASMMARKLVRRFYLKSFFLLSGYRTIAGIREGGCRMSADMREEGTYRMSAGIPREISAFITPKDNPNVSLLFGLPWLRSVDAKLLILKKEIHIRDVKKGRQSSRFLALPLLPRILNLTRRRKYRLI